MLTPSAREIAWMNNAMKLAREHDSFGKYSLVSLAVRGNRIYSVGYNYYPVRKSGESVDESYAGLGHHAELDALSKDSCEGTTLFIAGVVTVSGFSITTKPCGRCNALIKNSRIKRIVYQQDEKIVVELVRDMKIIPVREVKSSMRKVGV